MKQIFVYDDVFGKFSVDLQLISGWTTLSKKIRKNLSKTHVKVVMSSRSQVFKQRQVRNIKILQTTVCDFTSSEYAMTSEERRAIAEIYLPSKEAENLKLLPDSDCFHFSPCCVSSIPGTLLLKCTDSFRIQLRLSQMTCQ